MEKKRKKKKKSIYGEPSEGLALSRSHPQRESSGSGGNKSSLSGPPPGTMTSSPERQHLLSTKPLSSTHLPREKKNRNVYLIKRYCNAAIRGTFHNQCSIPFIIRRIVFFNARVSDGGKAKVVIVMDVYRHVHIIRFMCTLWGYEGRVYHNEG